MSAIIIAQIFSISIVKFWPVAEVEPPKIFSFDKRAIIVEEMIVTKQANAPAAPPKPQIPIPVPNDQVIDEIIDFPEFDMTFTSDPLSEGLTTGQRGDEEKISGNPDRPPRVIKIVEPVVPEEAKQAKIKAMITVNFLVLKDGSVKEAYISEIRKYKGESEEYELVKDIGFGLLEATIEAAYKWRFRPANEQGEKIGAYTQDVFTFGF